jgi:hypothetical protein
MRLILDLSRIYLRGTASRRRRSLLAVLAATIAVLATITGYAGPASASPSGGIQPDTPVVTVHLTNASTYCADVKNDNNHAGAAVWLYKCSQSQSYHWYELATECPGELGQPQCFVLVDKANDTLCLGLGFHAADARKAGLQNCGDGGDQPSGFAIWNAVAKNGLRNTGWGTEGDLVTATATSSAAIFGADRAAGGGGWWQWSGY